LLTAGEPTVEGSAKILILSLPALFWRSPRVVKGLSFWFDADADAADHLVLPE
jgi:hypothetical protein